LDDAPAWIEPTGPAAAIGCSLAGRGALLVDRSQSVAVFDAAQMVRSSGYTVAGQIFLHCGGPRRSGAARQHLRYLVSPMAVCALFHRHGPPALARSAFRSRRET
jgi:hypothetical protein